MESDMDGQLILHEDARSGNCYKIRLTAAHLDVPLIRHNYDIMRGETRTPAFLDNVNANGRIPVLQVGDRFLPESNAACFWLADGSHLIPADRFARADMLRWMFWEQYNHEPNVATLRFWRLFVGEDRLNETQRAQLSAKQASGEAALRLMDKHLAHHPWFAGDGFSLADICLFAYTHVAEAGGFELRPYQHVIRWLSAVAALPGHIVMEPKPALAA
jgi:glutathione S-transferase